MRCKNYSECKVGMAVFGYSKDDKEKYCSKHKLPDMVDVINKKCKYENCKKQPRFNFEGIKGGIYCKEHALTDMLDVVNKKCKYNGCKTQPVYNYEGFKKGMYCREHALTDMIDVHSKRCEYTDCKKQSYFNFPNEKGSRFCSKHKLNGMILSFGSCEIETCTTQASFNFPNEKGSKYCSKHKLDGMVITTSYICEDELCNIIASFNFPNEKGSRFCSNHKLDGMVTTTSYICEDELCNIIASFNLSNETIPRFCSKHKLDRMVTMTNKMCCVCNMVSARPHYKNHCYGCYSFKYPDDPAVRNHKTKENAIMSEIAKVFPDIILDKIIDGGCSKRRPDGMIDLVSHVIIVEVDENQHNGYDKECENRRIMELSQDLSHRPIVFIRINPDGYILNNKKQKGAFTLTKITGTLKVNKKILNERINATIDIITQYYEIIPSKTITVENLFFTQ